MPQPTTLMHCSIPVVTTSTTLYLGDCLASVAQGSGFAKEPNKSNGFAAFHCVG